MRIISAEIQDILSIQSASITFKDAGLVLVEGFNYDTQRANGAGKTALFNCITFALYDKLPRKITASEVLRRGSKTGFVKASVVCGNDVWTVVRSRPKGVKFFKNEVEQNISQEEFESFIRLSYEQFLLTIYTPQANSGKLKRFLSAPDSSKKDFLLQLLGLDQFSGAKKAVDEIIKQKQASVDMLTNKIANLRTKIETYEESLVDKDAIEGKLTLLKGSLVPLDKEVLGLSAVAKPDFSKFSSTEDGIRSKQQEIAQAKAKRSMLHDRYRELLSAIKDYDSNVACGECGSSLDTPEARSAHTDHQQKLKDKLAAVKLQIDEADVVISKEQNINDLSKKLRDKKQTESEDYQVAQARINELKAFIRSKQLDIQNAELKLQNNTEITNKIEALQKDVNDKLSNVANDKQDLELYKTLSAIYSPTGAQAYVLDSVVDSFNEVIQKYVDLLSPNVTYTLNSFKENSDGNVVAKFSETLTLGGKEVSVGSLSGGEEKGLSLCVDFALLEVLETQFGMSLNPIILDEPFDALDAAGREIVVNLLESLARNRQIFVVDHASESKAMFSESIRIELRNDISTINIDS